MSRPHVVRVEVVTLIRSRPAIVFDLELDADVHTASLAGSREQAETGTGRPALTLGDDVTFTARHLGRSWRLTSRVTEYERPIRFVDEQVTGPFRWLRHEHLFQLVDPGHTRMTDRMTFQAPLGVIGGLVARAVLGPYLRRLLQERARYVARLAETTAG